MTKPAAFRAAYADWRLIKTRQVVQVVFEIPISDADLAYRALGGMPDPAAERWFGIARLGEATKEAESVLTTHQDVPASRARKVAPEKRLAQQAGIACGDPVFWRYLREEHDFLVEDEQTAAAVVRNICAIASRSQIIPNTTAGQQWDALYSKYIAWREAPELVT